VGVTVGVGEGDTVGLAVGDAEGVTVGDGVGVGVGDGDGDPAAQKKSPDRMTVSPLFTSSNVPCPMGTFVSRKL